MAHTACVAHTGGGNDDLGGLILVYCLRFGLADGSVQSGEEDGVFARSDERRHLLIDIGCVALQEYTGRLNGEGTVDINGEIIVPMDEPTLLYRADKVQHLLRSAHGKGGNYDIAAAVECALDIVRKGRDIVGTVALVVAVAVGGLNKQIVSVADMFRVAQNGLVEVPDIAGEDHLFFALALVQPRLDGSRAKQVADIGKAHRHGVVYLHHAAVFAGVQEFQQAVDIVKVV